MPELRLRLVPGRLRDHGAPPTSRVVVDSDDGRVDVSGIDGPVDVDTDNGSIELADLSGAVQRATDNGRDHGRRGCVADRRPPTPTTAA